jgi:sugar O-acyltransferase (sialic acid O-acetyltransferase NeuD family)
LAHYYFSKTDSARMLHKEASVFGLGRRPPVFAFTVTKEYLEGDHFEGKPLVAFEDLTEKYPPGDYALFAPIVDSKLRKSIYDQGKAMGYKFVTYIHPSATVAANAEIGDNCFIFEDNTIQPFVKIGNNCVLWSGNHIGHHGTVKDHVFFTSHVVLAGHCVVESFAYLGVNSTIRDATTIAEGTFVAMSAAITKNTEEWGLYMGIPAKKVKTLDHD